MSSNNNTISVMSSEYNRYYCKIRRTMSPQKTVRRCRVFELSFSTKCAQRLHVNRITVNI